MIIRSQNKREITTDLNLHIEIQYIGSDDTLRAYIRNETVGTIGYYSTLEKAIKVLDMIQNAYMEYKIIQDEQENIHNAFKLPKSFQMPQDNEVYFKNLDNK